MKSTRMPAHIKRLGWARGSRNGAVLPSGPRTGSRCEGDQMQRIISNFVADEGGATAVEYSLIAGIVGVGIAIGLTSMKNVLVALVGRVVELF